MAASPQTPTPIPKPTIEKAVGALLKWKAKISSTQKPKLLSSEDEEFLYLVLTLNKIPAAPRTNAHKIILPNSLYTPESSEFCLFVHDSVSKSAKQKVEEQQIPVSKVIKLSKLKKDYKAYEQKRKLCDSFDMFFADKRIIPLLPNAIGKGFYRKKKIPVPVELGRGNWKDQIERVCKSALVYFGTGTCSVIKVAKASMSREEIVENVAAAIEGVVEVVPRKWKNVRGFHLKFAESAALPIFEKVPELGLKISGIEDNVEEKVVAAKKEKKVKEKVGKTKKKGRIHEVMYMDNADMVGEDESGSDEDDDNDNQEKAVVVMEGEKGASGGKKRKKEVKEVAKVKKGVKGLKEKKLKSSSEKKSKKSKKLYALIFNANAVNWNGLPM